MLEYDPNDYTKRTFVNRKCFCSKIPFTEEIANFQQNHIERKYCLVESKTPHYNQIVPDVRNKRDSNNFRFPCSCISPKFLQLVSKEENFNSNENYMKNNCLAESTNLISNECIKCKDSCTSEVKNNSAYRQCHKAPLNYIMSQSFFRSLEAIEKNLCLGENEILDVKENLRRLSKMPRYAITNNIGEMLDGKLLSKKTVAFLRIMLCTTEHLNNTFIRYFWQALNKAADLVNNYFRPGALFSTNDPYELAQLNALVTMDLKDIYSSPNRWIYIKNFLEVLGSRSTDDIIDYFLKQIIKHSLEPKSVEVLRNIAIQKPLNLDRKSQRNLIAALAEASKSFLRVDPTLKVENARRAVKAPKLGDYKTAYTFLKRVAQLGSKQLDNYMETPEIQSIFTEEATKQLIDYVNLEEHDVDESQLQNIAETAKKAIIRLYSINDNKIVDNIKNLDSDGPIRDEALSHLIEKFSNIPSPHLENLLNDLQRYKLMGYQQFRHVLDYLKDHKHKILSPEIERITKALEDVLKACHPLDGDINKKSIEDIAEALSSIHPQDAENYVNDLKLEKLDSPEDYQKLSLRMSYMRLPDLKRYAEELVAKKILNYEKSEQLQGVLENDKSLLLPKTKPKILKKIIEAVVPKPKKVVFAPVNNIRPYPKTPKRLKKKEQVEEGGEKHLPTEHSIEEKIAETLEESGKQGKVSSKKQKPLKLIKEQQPRDILGESDNREKKQKSKVKDLPTEHSIEEKRGEALKESGKEEKVSSKKQQGVIKDTKEELLRDNQEKKQEGKTFKDDVKQTEKQVSPVTTYKEGSEPIQSKKDTAPSHLGESTERTLKDIEPVQKRHSPKADIIKDSKGTERIQEKEPEKIDTRKTPPTEHKETKIIEPDRLLPKKIEPEILDTQPTSEKGEQKKKLKSKKPDFSSLLQEFEHIGEIEEIKDMKKIKREKIGDHSQDVEVMKKSGESQEDNKHKLSIPLYRDIQQPRKLSKLSSKRPIEKGFIPPEMNEMPSDHQDEIAKGPRLSLSDSDVNRRQSSALWESYLDDSRSIHKVAKGRKDKKSFTSPLRSRKEDVAKEKPDFKSIIPMHTGRRPPSLPFVHQHQKKPRSSKIPKQLRTSRVKYLPDFDKLLSPSFLDNTSSSTQQFDMTMPPKTKTVNKPFKIKGSQSDLFLNKISSEVKKLAPSSSATSVRMRTFQKIDDFVVLLTKLSSLNKRASRAYIMDLHRNKVLDEEKLKILKHILVTEPMPGMPRGTKESIIDTIDDLISGDDFQYLFSHLKIDYLPPIYFKYYAQYKFRRPTPQRHPSIDINYTRGLPQYLKSLRRTVIYFWPTAV